MRIDRITGACCVGPPRHVDLELAEGVVVGAAPIGGPAVAGAVTLAADGRLVVPAFVDAHVHLDKAYLIGHPALGDDLPSTLEGAIDAVGRLRGVLTLDDVRAGAQRAVDALVRNGTTAARVHVEIDPVTGLDTVARHRALADEVAARCRLQLVAFPQRGLELPGAVGLLRAAMAEGLAVVGGCPYVDDDPAAHLDVVFGLAERFGAPVDLHLDFSDDPGRSLLGLVVERTRSLGMAGQVTIGHVTTLAAMPALDRARALALLAGCDIALVALPATDLHLAGRGDPGTRSVAPVLDAVRAGVRVAIANNNIANPFSPFGNASLLQAAWLAGVAGRTATDADQRLLLDAISTTPAAILGLPERGVAVGAAADLAVLDTTDPNAVVRGAPHVAATLRSGRLVHRVDAPALLGP